MNTTAFKESIMKTNLNLNNIHKLNKADELNCFALAKYINKANNL